MAKVEAERNATIIALHGEGMRPIGIARKLGLSKGSVNGVLFRAGLTTATPVLRVRKRQWKPFKRSTDHPRVCGEREA